MKTIYIYIISFILFLSSCSPQKRITRIAEKYNLKAYEITTIRDTIIKPEVIYIESVSRNKEKIKDTIYIENNTLKNKIIITPDSLKLMQVLKADTIFYEREIPKEIIFIDKEQKNNWFGYILIFIISISATALYFKLRKA